MWNDPIYGAIDKPDADEPALDVIDYGQPYPPLQDEEPQDEEKLEW